MAVKRATPFAFLVVPVGALVIASLVTGCRMDAPERGEAREREAETGFRGRVHADPAPRPDFVLQDARGGTFDFREQTDGYLTLLFFGYTHCPDVCPIHMSSIAAVKRDLGEEFARHTKVIFVTVDPARDTPERLVSWLGNFDREFIGLYGDPAQIDSIQVGLGLPPAVVPDSSADDYVVGHGSPVIAWPADDRVRVDFPFGTRQEDWRHDLAKLAGGD
ncbi:MAG: SCO family protein [Gemmatimonadales bacterium]|jgi:protein SCO1/2